MVQFADEAIAQTTIPELLRQQRQFFSTGKTRSLEFRLEQLKRLKQAVLEHQDEVLAAVKADLNKPAVEGYLGELGVIKEISYFIKHLKGWVKPQRVKAPLQLENFPSEAVVYPEPLGVVLIIAPWNYPFNLLISPLVAAIAAGNCAMLKPSELAPHTSAVIARMIAKTFDPEFVAVVEGGVDVSQALLNEKFDHLFFTGGTAIGKVVMEAAAKHLTPVTLELGGKSPCIVDGDIQVDHAAKRIAWGKFLNAGQTCVAPDYLLVNRRIKADLLSALETAIHGFYGDDPARSPDYARIVNARHFSRLESLLQQGRILTGGQTNPDDRYIAPTLMDQVSLDAPIMQDEIFGPLLPIVEYDSLEEAIALINSKSKPLALYVFSSNQALQAEVLHRTSAGGVCINDTIMHLGVMELPFGGVGDSGMGRYHGKAGFDTFSHQKSVLRKSLRVELPFRYPPYAGKLDLIKKLMR